MTRSREPRRRWAAVPLALAVVLLASATRAADEDDDPEAPRAAQPVPVGVAAGPVVRYAERPARSVDHRACSAGAPICVHAASAADGPAALATLAAFERAWSTLTGALDLPPPDVDPVTLRYDVFLEGEGALGGELAETRLEARDVRSRVDRARAFSMVDRRVRSGCTLDALAAAELARAILFRVAPGTEEGTARAQAAYFSQLVAPCAVASAADAAQAFQSRSSRAVCDAHAATESAIAGGWSTSTSRADRLFSEGAALMWGRIDWAFGRSPGSIVRATWALSPTMTPPGAARWTNEPDTFDVLRASFKDALSRGSTVEDLMLDVAVGRAFLGAADDGLHLPESRPLGEAARVPLDWDVPWPDKPRRLSPRAPVHPTGASYLLVHTRGARPGARLRAEIEWEEHALFRWAFVKLDAQGRELGRVVIPTTERATEARMTLVALEGVDRVLLVGVNTGDPAYPFDPDDESWEPHGWLVTIAEE